VFENSIKQVYYLKFKYLNTRSILYVNVLYLVFVIFSIFFLTGTNIHIERCRVSLQQLDGPAV